LIPIILVLVLVLVLVPVLILILIINIQKLHISAKLNMSLMNQSRKIKLATLIGTIQAATNL
jgi:hypothetical protein